MLEEEINLYILAASGNLHGIKKALSTETKGFFKTDEEKGWTPLHYAAYNSKYKIVEAIVNAGVDPNVMSVPPMAYKYNSWNCAQEENLEGMEPIVQPMDVANGPNRLKIVRFLIKNGGRFAGDELTLHQAVQLEDIDEIDAILEDDSLRINGRDDRGWMAIHYAVESNNMEVVKLLLDNKANINGSTYTKDVRVNFNAWEMANPKSFGSGNQEMFDFLVSKGAKSHPGVNNTQRETISLKDQFNANKIKAVNNVDISGKLKEMKGEREKEEERKKILQKPDSILGKIFESKEDKDRRQIELEKIEKERQETEKIKQEKKEQIEKARKVESRARWITGSDPFKLKGESIKYDNPCTAHTYFMDIVGYSKKGTEEQRSVMDKLISIVKSTKSFIDSQQQGKLIILPTGDGMALVFFNDIHTAFKCAIDVGRRVYKSESLGVRNGIYSGPVVPVKDINGNPNVSGAGINMAQRCMDAGDNDHILISNDVYQYVCETKVPGLSFDDWGPVVIKHGTTMHLWTAYGPGFGRSEFPDWRGTKRINYKEKSEDSSSEN